jgi:hypothetical protein
LRLAAFRQAGVEGAQTPVEMPELLDPARKLRPAPADDLTQPSSRLLASPLGADRRESGGRLERDVELAQPHKQSNSLEVAGPKVSVTSLTSGWLRQQALVLVEPDRLRSDPEAPGDLADLHDLRLDLGCRTGHTGGT